MAFAVADSLPSQEYNHVFPSSYDGADALE